MNTYLSYSWTYIPVCTGNDKPTDQEFKALAAALNLSDVSPMSYLLIVSSLSRIDVTRLLTLVLMRQNKNRHRD